MTEFDASRSDGDSPQDFQGGGGADPNRLIDAGRGTPRQDNPLNTMGPTQPMGPMTLPQMDQNPHNLGPARQTSAHGPFAPLFGGPVPLEYRVGENWVKAIRGEPLPINPAIGALFPEGSPAHEAFLDMMRKTNPLMALAPVGSKDYETWRAVQDRNNPLIGYIKVFGLINNEARPAGAAATGDSPEEDDSTSLHIPQDAADRQTEADEKDPHQE